MAFIIDNFTSIRGSDKPNDVQGKYAYRTTDARAVTAAVNYFLTGYTKVYSTDTTTKNSTQTQSFINKLFEGDVIEVQQVDANGLVVDSYDLIVAAVVTGAAPLLLTSTLHGDVIVAVGKMDDISTAEDITVTFGIPVELLSVTYVLGGAITTANAIITPKIGATAIPGASLTIPYAGSGLGVYGSSIAGGLRSSTAFVLSGDGGSTGVTPAYFILKARQVTGHLVRVTTTIPDISTANSAGYAVAPVGGKIVRIQSVLQGAIATADAAITNSIGATPITGGGLTVATAGSAAGDLDSATPTAANVVTEGQILKALSDGASTNAVPLPVTFWIYKS